MVQLWPIANMSETATQETISFKKRRLKLERILEPLLISFCIRKLKGKGANSTSSLVLEPRLQFTFLAPRAFDNCILSRGHS